jgi:hypothetical protein
MKTDNLAVTGLNRSIILNFTVSQEFYYLDFDWAVVFRSFYTTRYYLT